MIPHSLEKVYNLVLEKDYFSAKKGDIWDSYNTKEEAIKNINISKIKDILTIKEENKYNIIIGETKIIEEEKFSENVEEDLRNFKMLHGDMAI